MIFEEEKDISRRMKKKQKTDLSITQILDPDKQRAGFRKASKQYQSSKWEEND